MNSRFACFPVLLSMVLGCSQPEKYTPPTFSGDGMLAGTTPVPSSAYRALDGNYIVAGDNRGFGTSIVLRVTRTGLSFFGAENGAYATMRAGCTSDGSALILEGYWRHSVSLATGLVRMRVEPASVASALCSGSPAVERARLRGGFASDSDENVGENTTISYERPLVEGTDRFQIVAHHGCRTIEQCGASENTVEVVRLVEGMGATGIELDVVMTRDGIPILYHDANFSPRLTRGRYCFGPVEDFSLSAVRDLCRAKYGEAIPTLEEALTAIVDQTTLTAVWLDLKTPSAIPASMDAVERAQARAVSAARNVQFALGLPDEESLQTFVALRGSRPVNCLYELDPDLVVSSGCSVWGPRWTEGPQVAKVRELQSRGIGVAFWTLNEVAFIDEVLRAAGPNGIVTDRPGVVLHRLQQIGVSATGGIP